MPKSVVHHNSGKPLYLVAERQTTASTDQIPKKIYVSPQVVKIVTALDDGSANDGVRSDPATGTRRNIQKALVFGKTYEFQVVLRESGEPDTSANYEWQYSYQSPEFSKNTLITKKLPDHGNKASVTIDDPDMCGCQFTVTAYVGAPEEGHTVSPFVHNRFRWFDGKIVKDQIEGRLAENWRINQGHSSLCGMAAVYYAMLKKRPQEYKKLATELHRTGHYLVNENDLVPDKSMYEVDPEEIIAAGEAPRPTFAKMQMPEVDWIVLAGTRSALSDLSYNGLEGNKRDQFAGINWPGVMIDAIEKYAGCNIGDMAGMSLGSIIWKILFSPNCDAEKTLHEIDKKYQSGSQILLLICPELVKQGGTSTIALRQELHWIAYAGNLQLRIANDHLKFDIYTWARDPASYNSYSGIFDKLQSYPPEDCKLKSPAGININAFSTNYYGYIEIK